MSDTKSDQDFELALEEASNMSGPSDKSQSSIVAPRRAKTKRTKRKKTKTTSGFPGSEMENDGYEVRYVDHCRYCRMLDFLFS